ncbi:MAG: hypothetical protein U0M92_03550 [Bacilli bacterium]
MSKKKCIVIFIIAILLVTILFFVIYNLSKSNKLSKRISSYYNNLQQDMFEMNINDFVDFEWDYMIIYKNPTSASDIKEIAGIIYEKELDLESGMIFVKDNKIIYEETFKTDFETPYQFIIYPYQDVNSKLNVNKIEKEKAMFSGKKIKYNNENRYTFYPLFEN